MNNQTTFSIDTYKYQWDTGSYVYRSDIIQRIQSCFQTAIQSHCKVFAVRLDIRFPQGFVHDGTNSAISALLHRLKAHYDYHKIDCRYVWAREQNISAAPHYHLLLLLNGSNIQNGWGPCSLTTGLWGSILNTNAAGLINLCQPGPIGGIMIRRPTSHSLDAKQAGEVAQFETTYREAYRWAAYLAKTYTKGNAPHGVREFGSSHF